MYARNNDARRDCREICPPENYSGNAFPEHGCDEVCAEDDKRQNDVCAPEKAPEPPSPDKMCGNFAPEKCAADCPCDECRFGREPPCRDDCKPPCDDRKKPEPPCPPPKSEGLIDRLFGKFKGFRKEDLLLIGLVLFLILGDNDEKDRPCDDDRQDNSDLLLILALILLLS